MVDQEKIHNQCLSDDPEERIKAIEQLHHFASLPNKQQAWGDYQRLINDEHSNVRSKAASAFSYVFHYVPDKQQA